MELTTKNFCPNIKNVSDNMRTAYICKITGKVCPKVDYSSGKALPSKFFVKNGCQLIKEETIQEEQLIEKEVKNKSKKNTKNIIDEVVDKVVEVIEEPIKEIKEEEKEAVIEEEVKEENPTYNKPKTNNYKKKSNNRNNKKK